MTAVSRTAMVELASPIPRSLFYKSKGDGPVQRFQMDMTSWTEWHWDKVFSLQDVDDGTGLMLKRTTITLEAFLEYQGRTIDEACERFSFIQSMRESRAKQGADRGWYLQFENLEIFYDQLGKNNVLGTVDLEEIEWY